MKNTRQKPQERNGGEFMKAIKKMIAIILAVCMLVGMPLSMDVSAIESGSSAITPLTKMELR